MNWRQLYQKKLTTAEEAVKAIKSGDRVVLGHCCGEPQHLVKTLIANKNRYTKVEIVHLVAMGAGEYCQPENDAHFIHNSLFAGTSTREAINNGRAKFTPCFISEVPRLFKENILPVDVTLCTISPPDEHGYCSFGISVDYTKPAVEASQISIAQVNRYMPRTLGDAFIHISQIDYLVEYDEPLIEQQPPEIGPVEKEIGRNCAELIEDGACLQLGIGAIPDCILAFLTHKKDLGLHTEMFSDGAVELIENGVINCAQKNLNPGKIVATFLMGTRKLYEFVDNNPLVEMHPVNYTNDPYIIGCNDKMIAINSCLQVDLMGQVASDSLGTRQYSGVGGQIDFMRGASRSKGGKAILAFPATAAGGQYSRIVPCLDSGATLTVSRYDAHYFVTEYGVADVRGKSLGERAKALVNIAHPHFRADLVRQISGRKIFTQ